MMKPIVSKLVCDNFHFATLTVDFQLGETLQAMSR